MKKKLISVLLTLAVAGTMFFLAYASIPSEPSMPVT